MNLAKRIRVIAIEILVVGGFLLILAAVAFFVPGAAVSSWVAAWLDLVLGVTLLLVGGELVSLSRLAPSVPAPLLP
ncbi:MAG: hypothetical protein L3K23_09535 [Thermoplasmata archaeon]|nr:hypothetical protein [Thermoplasmata archaeon]